MCIYLFNKVFIISSLLCFPNNSWMNEAFPLEIPQKSYGNGILSITMLKTFYITFDAS